MITGSIGRKTLVAVTLGQLTSCAEIQGYPHDPEDTDAVMSSLETYLNPTIDNSYYSIPATDQADRDSRRNTIVLSRMRAFNIEFAKYERGLWENGNEVVLGTDVASLGLTAAATTSTGATAKALSAAALAVTGAGTAFSKDLYFSKTLPALMAQMEANRAKAEVTLLNGLKQHDSEYPLAAAEIDLDILKSAGGLPEAISSITQTAGTQKAVENVALASVRSGPVSTDSASVQLGAWAETSPDNLKKLAAWMAADKVDPNLAQIPPPAFWTSDDPTMLKDQARAIACLIAVPSNCDSAAAANVAPEPPKPTTKPGK